ncbi:MAG: glycosyl hydrolase family 32 domain protein, partial [SAR202 cluster bacterium]|nr:glycosyl hydrolase family 32 domain protein [SAR202 cluster bacterium]
SYSSILPDALSRAPETTTITLGHNEPLQLRIFIDRSVVEVFVNDKACAAVRVYPGLSDSTGVSIRAQGSEARLLSLDAWNMKNIYE